MSHRSQILGKSLSEEKKKGQVLKVVEICSKLYMKMKEGKMEGGVVGIFKCFIIYVTCFELSMI